MWTRWRVIPDDNQTPLRYSCVMRLSGRRASPHASHWSPPQKVALYSLLGLNLAFFALHFGLRASAPHLLGEYLGLSYRGIDQAYAWQFFSAMFFHSGIGSFAVAMLVLYLVGRDLECILGQKHFICLYFVGILGGEFGHLLLMPANTVLLAASGGIAAFVFAYTTILPEIELNGPLPFLSFKVKAKYVGYGFGAIAAIAMLINREGVVGHSAWLGGCAVGWAYAHLLGFGQPLFIQRSLQRRRVALERKRHMSTGDFIAEEIDPLLEKISRCGLASLTRSERRKLAQAREKMAEQSP
jgi:membrane associated rhomboid family serine protease